MEGNYYLFLWNWLYFFWSHTDKFLAWSLNRSLWGHGQSGGKQRGCLYWRATEKSFPVNAFVLNSLQSFILDCFSFKNISFRAFFKHPSSSYLYIWNLATGFIHTSFKKRGLKKASSLIFLWHKHCVPFHRPDVWNALRDICIFPWLIAFSLCYKGFVALACFLQPRWSSQLKTCHVHVIVNCCLHPFAQRHGNSTSQHAKRHKLPH